MKSFGKIVTFVLLVCFLAACGKTEAPVATEAPAAEQPAVEQPAATEAPASAFSGAQDEWLKANQLGPYDTGEQDWAAIEEAAKAEGTVLVYANTSKIEKAAAAFMEQYPEINVQGFDLGGDDVALKTKEEQKAGAFTGDIWMSSGGAELMGEIMPKNYVWRFVPDNLSADAAAKYSDPLLINRFGARIFAYNTELNETCPITNLWELTNEEWKGKVFIEDPLNDASTLSMLITIASKADVMKQAYVDQYGSEPVLDEDTPDAGWLWLKRFAQNGPVPMSGGDEVDEAFATPGMTDSYIGFTSYSNMSAVEDGELAFDACWGLNPVVSVVSQSYLGILNQAPHPNAAKLFIRFLMTEEGRDPWAKFGTYFADPTYVVPEGQKTLEEFETMSWYIDEMYAYENMVQARDFYLLNLGK